MTTRRTTEAAESAAFWAWVQTFAPLYPGLRLAVHVMNEGKRGPHVARQSGISKGMPDVLCFARRGGYNGWARELKVHPNTPTPEQRAWIAALEGEGWNAGILTMREPGDWAMVARDLGDYLGIPAAALP